MIQPTQAFYPPTVHWDVPTDASHYRIQVATGSTNVLSEGTRYYWHVRATNEKLLNPPDTSHGFRDMILLLFVGILIRWIAVRIGNWIFPP